MMNMKLSELVAVLTKIQEVYGGDLSTNVDRASVGASVYEKYSPYSNQGARTTSHEVRIQAYEDRAQPGPMPGDFQ
jgi:hypothetical protein